MIFGCNKYSSVADICFVVGSINLFGLEKSPGSRIAAVVILFLFDRKL